MLIELKNGRRKKFPPALGKVIVARGLGAEVQEAEPDNTYQTRMMQAAPYGYKADGSRRKRPGRVSKEA